MRSTHSTLPPVAEYAEAEGNGGAARGGPSGGRGGATVGGIRPRDSK
jgi:hypothetical protein